MPERTKRIIQIIIFSLLVFAMGLGIWWFFFRPVFVPSIPSVPVAPEAPPVGGLPIALPAPPRLPVAPAPPSPARPSPTATGGLTSVGTLARNPTLGPALAPDGTALQYYNRTDGKFYRIRPDGTVEALSDRVFFNVSVVTWAPDSNQAVLEYPDGSNIVYNFETERAATLPRHWQQFDFSPRSDQLSFLSIGADEDSRWLAISAPDGSKSRPLEPLGENASAVQVAWSPNDQIVAFSKAGSPQGIGEFEVLLVGKQGENFRSLKINGVGFIGKWSPDGERILYSATDASTDWKPQIWIVDGRPDRIGANKTPLGIETWADKCTFASATMIYCAVPTTLQRGAGLYPAVVGNTPDELWRINLTTGERQRIATPAEDHTIDRIVVSKDEQYLYFTDRISGQLYKINLK